MVLKPQDVGLREWKRMRYGWKQRTTALIGDASSILCAAHAVMHVEYGTVFWIMRL